MSFLKCKQNKAGNFVLILLSLFALTWRTYAQNAPYREVSIAAPTAASLAKYVDVPVNQHTGIPNIAIPITTIKEGPLELPISLSYHAGGLKVLEPASWVGLGWSLNAGGVISRTVRGAPDEKGTNSVFGQTHGHYTDKGYSNYLIIPGSITDHPEQFKQDWKEIADGRKDGEPDLFFFNVAGYSGKFYFNDDQTPVLVPQQDIRIDCVFPIAGSSIPSFILTVADGTKFYFGRTSVQNDVDPVEETDPFTGEGGLSEGKVISSWFLNRIESSDGLFTITLTYTSEQYAYHTLSTFPVPGNNVGFGGTAINFEYKLVKNIVKGVRLLNIKSGNQEIRFVGGSFRQDVNDTYRALSPDLPNTSAMTLGAVVIADPQGNCIKRFDLHHGYFDDAVTPLTGYFAFYSLNSDRKRLRLDGVTERSCSGSIAVPHTFEYYADLVPRRLSFAQDHWGFYNGQLSNTTLIPSFVKDTFETVAGANREAAWPAMRAGALRRIIYPTGGSTLFNYEPHNTWVSFSTKRFLPVSGGSLSAGFDGSSAAVSNSVVIPQSPVRYTLNNERPGGVATFILRNGSHKVFETTINSGQKIEGRIYLAPGTYTITLQKSPVTSGNGVTVSLEAFTPETVQRNELVGGLRIASIVQQDDITTLPMTTRYAYQYNDGRSSGVLYSRPVYVQKVRNDILKLVGSRFFPTPTPDGCGWEVPENGSFYKTGGSLQPLATTQGNHIGYNEVSVIRPGNGFSIYRYFGSELWDNNTGELAVRSINTKACNMSIPNYPAAPQPFEFLRGELKYEGHFAESGKIISETEYHPIYEQNPVFTPGLIVNYAPWEAPPPGTWQSSGGGPAPNLATYYSLFTARKKELRRVIRTYSSANGSFIEEAHTQMFESTQHNALTRERTTTFGSNEVLETRYRYSADLTPANCAVISNCWPEYATLRQQYEQQFNIAFFAQCSNHTCRWDAWQSYIRNCATARQAYTNCRAANLGAMANCLQAARDAASPLLRPVLLLQAKNMVVPIERTKWKNNHLIQAEFTVYDFGIGTAGGVYPRFLKKIPLATPSAIFTPAGVSGSTLIMDGRYTDDVSIIYERGNIAELRKKDGVPVSYLWGYKQNLPIATITGVGAGAIQAFSPNLNLPLLENPANDQVLRTELAKIRSAFPTAKVATYTFDPIKGMTSQTDANGRVTYYEYDALGRLMLIRDHDQHIVKRVQYRYKLQAGE